MCSLRKEGYYQALNPNFLMVVGVGKGGMQESFCQFVAKCMSTVVSFSGPLLTFQMVTSTPTTRHTHIQTLKSETITPICQDGPGTALSVNLNKDNRKM